MKLSLAIDSHNFSIIESILDSSPEDPQVIGLFLNLFDERLENFITKGLRYSENEVSGLLAIMKKSLDFSLISKSFNSIELFITIFLESENLEVLSLGFEILSRVINENIEVYEKTSPQILRLSYIAHSYFLHFNGGVLENKVKLYEMFNKDPGFEKLNGYLKESEREKGEFEDLQKKLVFEVTSNVKECEEYQELGKKDFSGNGKQWRRCEEILEEGFNVETICEKIRKELDIKKDSPKGDALKIRVKFAKFLKEQKREQILEVILKATWMSGTNLFIYLDIFFINVSEIY